MSDRVFVSRNIDFGKKMSEKLESKTENKSLILPDLISTTISMTKQTTEEDNNKQSTSQIEEENDKFTVFSYTQNLSSVLTDPGKSRNEKLSFFTRDWGESFIQKTSFHHSINIPSVTVDHFRSYIGYYGKKYRHYVRSKRALQRMARKSESSPSSYNLKPSSSMSSISSSIQTELHDVPKIFLDSKFSLNDPCTFSIVFMQSSSQLLHSLNPFADDMPESIEEEKMVFRPQKEFRETLEQYHDIVESRLCLHLASKSQTFFRAVTSHNKLVTQLEETKQTCRKLREQMAKLESSVVRKSINALAVHRARENCGALLRKLEVVNNVREAQMTVQMFLNNYNYPGALDVISTAQAVLHEDLNGIVCFRHLSTQLDGLKDAISTMLQHEFVKIVQNEFGKSVNNENDMNIEEDQLNPVVLGLLRVRQFLFCEVLRQEIESAVRKLLRQTVRGCIADNDQVTEFDSNISSLGDQMRKMDFDQWLSLLDLVFGNLYLFCRKIEMVQDVLLDLIDIAAGKCLPPSAVPSIEQQNVHLPLAQHIQCPLTVPCDTLLEECDYLELRQAISQLTSHTTTICQDRSARFIQARSKDGFIEKLTTDDFVQLVNFVEDFIDRCDQLSITKSTILRSTLQNQASKFVARFHDDRKGKLSNILDSEHWRMAEIPEVFQKIVDKCQESGVLRDIDSSDTLDDEPMPYLMVGKEQYTVVGTSLILLQMMAQYCQTVDLLPTLAPDLLIRVVELLKNFNSRTCQLILGAGALQLVGLKTISVKNLALACRCLQLISYHVQFAQKEFERHLPDGQRNLCRHFVQVNKDYDDHVQEIFNKLISVMDHHTSTCIMKWEFQGSIPSQSFQQIGKHLKKFYEGLTGILPNDQIQKIFFRVHDNFKRSLKARLNEIGVTPRDGATYGIVCSEFSYYMEVLRSLSCCAALNDTLADVMTINN